MDGLSSTDEPVVDIYGREIPSFIVARSRQEVCLLSDLKQIGFNIFRKSQYAKLSGKPSDFEEEFQSYMLESAGSYLLKNKMLFTQEQIMSSIEKTKQLLIGNQTIAAKKENTTFLKDRKIESLPDDEIRIHSVATPHKSSLRRITYPRSPQKPHRPSDDESSSSEISNYSLPSYPTKFTKQGAPPRQNTQTANKILKTPNDTALEEHEVMVTAIDKSNCIWVREPGFEEILEELQTQLQEEAKKQSAARKPWRIDAIYVAQYEDDWYRCRIVKFKPLIVIFLDYGTTAAVDEIRQVSEHLATFPFFAKRITFKEATYTPSLEDIITVRPIKKNDDGTIFVHVLPRNSTRTNPRSSRRDTSSPKQHTRSKSLTSVHQRQRSTVNSVQHCSNAIPSEDDDDEDWNAPRGVKQTPESTPKEPVFFKIPPSFSSLKNEQRVAISHVKDNVLYLRTREDFQKLRGMENVIESYVRTANSVRNVKNGQLVLCKRQPEGKYCRAVVKHINDKQAEVDLLDYGQNLTVDWSTLKAIDKKLSMEPITLFAAGRLQGFERESLNQQQIDLIAGYAAKQKKFTVVLGFEDELDLDDGVQFLSKELKSLKNNFAKVLLKDVKIYKPEIGINSYVCGSYKNSQEFTLLSSDKLSEYVDVILRSEMEDEQPYVPIVGEVCLCFHLDCWYRCVAIKIFDKECEVLLLDFGNIEIIKKQDVRKPSSDVTEIPALAIPCVLSGLPRRENIEELLHKFLFEGDIYKVDIKVLSEGKYHVEIPSVYKAIQEL